MKSRLPLLRAGSKNQVAVAVLVTGAAIATSTRALLRQRIATRRDARRELAVIHAQSSAVHPESVGDDAQPSDADEAVVA